MKSTTPHYWLIKSEASCYSIDDLQKDKKTSWGGVRNYQARNFMRDNMRKGDFVLFYHSSSDPIAICGIAKVASPPYLDRTALDPKDDHFDPHAVTREKEIADGKKSKDDHLWVAVDIAFVRKFKHPISLGEIKRDPALKGIMVAQKGSRLSIQPISETHFRYITKILAV